MKKFVIIFCLLSFTMTTVAPSAQAAMDPRIKALGSMALYGTIGGALLGTASLAFGTEGRSVAKGASIGLYAGLLFGSYVVVSHAMKKRGDKELDQQPSKGDDYYPDTENSPYEKDDGYSGGYAPESTEEAATADFWRPYWEQEAREDWEQKFQGANRKQGQTYYLNLINFQF